MAILTAAGCRGGVALLHAPDLQAQHRMQQLHAKAEQMRRAAEDAETQHGEASHEYQAALERWREELEYMVQRL